MDKKSGSPSIAPGWIKSGASFHHSSSNPGSGSAPFGKDMWLIGGSREYS
jgi:hypothetical protein